MPGLRLPLDIPRLRQGQEAHCPVCNHEIVEVENNPYIAPIAYALTTLILMAFAYNMVYIRVRFVRRDINFVAAANDAAFDFAGLRFSGGSDVYPHLRRALTVSAALPLCLHGFDTRKGLSCAALCNACIGAAAPLDYGGCVFLFPLWWRISSFRPLPQ